MRTSNRIINLLIVALLACGSASVASAATPAQIAEFEAAIEAAAVNGGDIGAVVDAAIDQGILTESEAGMAIARVTSQVATRNPSAAVNLQTFVATQDSDLIRLANITVPNDGFTAAPATGTNPVQRGAPSNGGGGGGDAIQVASDTVTNVITAVEQATGTTLDVDPGTPVEVDTLEAIIAQAVEDAASPI